MDFFLVWLALAFLSLAFALPVRQSPRVSLPMIKKGAVQSLISKDGLDKHLRALQSIFDKDHDRNPSAKSNATVGYIEQVLNRHLDYWNATITPVSVNFIEGTKLSYNLCAQTKKGNQNEVLVLGAHHDAKDVDPGDPGINENGSGVAALLEVVERMAHFGTNNAVRVCFWAMEEQDSYGSSEHVTKLTKDERNEIRLYFNADTLGSINFAYFIHSEMDGTLEVDPPQPFPTKPDDYSYGRTRTVPFANGTSQATTFLQSWFESQGLNHTVIKPEDTHTDTDAFVYAGIPVAGLESGSDDPKTQKQAALFGGQADEPYDSEYHESGDNYTNVNMEPLFVNTRAIAAAVEHWGTSFDDIPRRHA